MGFRYTYVYVYICKWCSAWTTLIYVYVYVHVCSFTCVHILLFVVVYVLGTVTGYLLGTGYCTLDVSAGCLFYIHSDPSTHGRPFALSRQACLSVLEAIGLDPDSYILLV